MANPKDHIKCLWSCHWDDWINYCTLKSVKLLKHYDAQKKIQGIMMLTKRIKA